MIFVPFLSFCWCSLWRWWGRRRWKRAMLVEFTPLPLCFSAFDSGVLLFFSFVPLSFLSFFFLSSFLSSFSLFFILILSFFCNFIPVKTFTVEKINPCSLHFSLLSLTASLSCVFLSFFSRFFSALSLAAVPPLYLL